MTTRLLRDVDLEALISGANPICENLPSRKRTKDTRLDPIQAASIDLHIGEIYCPGLAANKSGSASKPKAAHSLQAGETIVVRTKEKLVFPKHIAGVGFGCTSLARQGILTPTIGHVDPGWVGHLRVVLINMGSDAVDLAEGQHVGTVLVFDLGAEVKCGYADRNSAGSGYSTRDSVGQDMLDDLSRDFANLKEVARNEGKQAANDTRWELNKSLIWSTGILLVMFLLVPVTIRIIIDQYDKYAGYAELSAKILRAERLEGRVEFLERIAVGGQLRVPPPAPGKEAP